MFQISTGGMNRASENAWQDFLVTSFEPLSCEKNIKSASFEDGADTVIVSSLMVQMPRIQLASATCWLCPMNS